MKGEVESLGHNQHSNIMISIYYYLLLFIIKYRKKYKQKKQQNPVRTVSEAFRPRAPKKVAGERKKRVESFLLLDENSILLQGKKDTIGRREKKQRRILTSTLKDLHKAYNDNSDEMRRMSYRQFIKYKPF